MEAGAVPREAPAGALGILSPRMLRMASDARLVAWVREGRVTAFEALYDRHHQQILSFCQHMLGSREEAEDAVQHTFLAAYNELAGGEKLIHLRAWLFTIARNRCYSVLRKRREHPLEDIAEPATEGLATLVQRRQDLRDLVRDMHRLPDSQRAALILAEMDALNHEQIGVVLGVPTAKVKALVFQARESLLASRSAREADCHDIREQLANLRGGALRRTQLRRHLRECPGCREYRKGLDAQRRRLRLLLPVAPTIALKETLLSSTGGGAATGVIGGGLMASSTVKGVGLAGALLAGIGAADTIVAVQGVPHVWPGPSQLRQHPALERSSGSLRAGQPAPAVGGAVAIRTLAVHSPAASASASTARGSSSQYRLTTRSAPGHSTSHLSIVSVPPRAQLREHAGTSSTPSTAASPTASKLASLFPLPGSSGQVRQLLGRGGSAARSVPQAGYQAGFGSWHAGSGVWHPGSDTAQPGGWAGGDAHDWRGSGYGGSRFDHGH